MEIASVQLTVSDLEAAMSFFTETLELPRTTGSSANDISIGRTRLGLAEGPRFSGAHHVAFDIPPSTFDEHRDWLAARVPLLRNADGVTEFEGPAGWNSRSVYFEGPDRMVLELIARRERPREPRRTPQLVSISEVGIAVADVDAAVATLAETLGLPVFGSSSSEFAPVGDHDGLIILVRTGRTWLPVFDVAAEPMPVRLRLRSAGRLAADPGRTIRFSEQASVTI